MKKIVMIFIITIAAASVTFGQKKMSNESKAQPQSTANKTGHGFSFNHLALSVRDVNRSAEFYGNVLGLEEITNRTKIDGIRWFSLGDGKELHLISILKDDFKINKAIHFALAMSDVGSFVKKLESMKIAYSDWPGNLGKVTTRADGIKQVYFQDPDGYWIELNSVAEGQADMPGDRDRSVESQIIAIEKAGWQAWKNKDVKWFQENMSEELLDVTSDGVFSKADVIRSTSADCDVKSVSLDNLKFVMLSNDVVVLTYTAKQDGVCSGKKIPSQVRATVNYVKRNGKWLEAMYMETPVAQ